jgi:hypothetical protein
MVRIIGPNMDEMQEWNYLINKELHNFYSSSRILSGYINEDEMNGRFNIEGESNNIYKLWLESLVGRGHVEGIGVRILFKQILENCF